MTNWQYFTWRYRWERSYHGRIYSFRVALRETFKPTPF